MPELSDYQKRVLYWYTTNAGNGKNLVVNACAGSGKTFTAIELFKIAVKLGMSAVYIAFNKDIRYSVMQKLPRGVASETYHSHGFRAIRNAFGGAQQNENKVLDFLKGDSRMTYLKWKVKKLVTLCKINGIDSPDDDLLYRLAEDNDVDFEDNRGILQKAQMDLAFKKTREAMEFSRDNPTVVDFDDMLYLPYAMQNEISMPQYDLVVIDELQDTSFVQMHLALRSVTEHGNIIGIGDPFQSIYAYRGAGSTSFQDFREGTGAEELPLSLCYRCPTTVRDYVNRKFPYIRFETPEWAEAGILRDIPEGQAVRQLEPGDLVLCRVNADLVSLAFDLIRAGKRTIVKGRQIGKGIQSLIKKSNAGTTTEFINWLSAWRDREIEKATRLDNPGKVQDIQDKYDTILVIADGTIDVDEIALRCDALFVEGDQNAIQLSTVHKAKGLEADNVYILRPDLLPHPAAWKPVDIEQEKNIEYVAVTRAKKALYFIKGEDKKLTAQQPLFENLPLDKSVTITPLPFQF